MIAAAAEGRGGDHHRSLTSVATWSLASAVKRSNEGLASGPRGGEDAMVVAMEGQSFFCPPGLLCLPAPLSQKGGCGNVACAGDQS